MYNFGEWDPSKHHTVNCIKFIKNIFYINDYFTIENSYNPEAGKVYKHNYGEYKAKCVDSVDESKACKFEADESCIKFSKPTALHDKLLKNLKERPEKSVNEKVEGFKNWLIGTWKDSLF